MLHIFIRQRNVQKLHRKFLFHHIIHDLLAITAASYIFFHGHQQLMVSGKHIQHLCINRLYKSCIDQCTAVTDLL